MVYYQELNPRSCTGADLDLILSLGWYPMGQTIFTTSHLADPAGAPGNRVHWLRYPVEKLAERASLRRIIRLNSRFSLETVAPFDHHPGLNELYARYLDSVDFDGYPSVEDATFYEGQSNIFDSRALIVREGERIVACGIFHEGENSIASILHFYDPAYGRYSPGKYLILKTLEYCRSRNIEWYYPGYVIQDDSKMDYKLFLGEEWAQYYYPEPDPRRGIWLSFSPDILTSSV